MSEGWLCCGPSVHSHFDIAHLPFGLSCANLPVSESPFGENMNNVFDEKMTDIIIGEMVTQLLNEDASISWSILLERLQQFLDMERDETRLRAALRAMEEIRAEMLLHPAETTGVEPHPANLHQLH